MRRHEVQFLQLPIVLIGLLISSGCAEQSLAATPISKSGPRAHTSSNERAGEPASKPRLVVLTDISSITPGVREPDDAQSMIRLMLYANEFDIEGLIASSSLQHGQVVRPELIRRIVNAYSKVQPNLLLHDPDYPKADALRRVIKSGQPHADEDVPIYETIGERKDTEASEWIIQTVDKPDARPVWFSIWGGPADLAQALWKVRKTRSPEETRAFVAKLRVAASGDQDSTAAWIKSNFPELFYATRSGGGRGIYRGGDAALASSEWIQHNMRGHGALGDLYPDYDGGDKYSWQLGPVNGIKGGDSGSWMGLIPNGLNVPSRLTWTNWGGRLEADPQQPNRYHDAIDRVRNYDTDMEPYWAAVYRWRADFQSDYAARFDWSIKPYAQANHAPVRRAGSQVIHRKVRAGARVTLESHEWKDPDGNNLSFQWQVLNEETAVSDDDVVIERSSSRSAWFIAPVVERPQSIHVLLTVTDDGEPALSSYQRFNFIVYSD